METPIFQVLWLYPLSRDLDTCTHAHETKERDESRSLLGVRKVPH